MFNNIIQTINPTTGEVLKEYLIADKQHVSSVIDKSKKTFNDSSYSLTLEFLDIL
jgi:hypothetical protein